MSDHDRWTINELITRYELEPNLQDIFVEGTYDKEIFVNCFRSSGQKDKVVYDINVVEVPNELVVSDGLTYGNKQRVIVLARELATITEDCSYKCVVDRDLDHWFESLEVTPRLVWMEFCSVELYFFTKEIIENLLINTARSKINDINEYITSLVEVLSTLYALRLTDRQLASSLTWLSIDRCLSRNSNKIELHVNDYIDRTLLSNNKIHMKTDFHDALHYWQEKLTGDPKNHIRGHDFIASLAWTIKNFKGMKEFAVESTIERAFIMISPNSVELEHFLKFQN